MVNTVQEGYSGKSFDSHVVLEQWKTCVEMANEISSRRDTMNNLFVTLNLAFIAAISLTWDAKISILSVVSIVVNIIWLLLIRYYKKINEAKYKIILKMEKDLPFQAFSDEWKVYKSGKYSINGTTLELLLPCTFITAYLIMLLAILSILII